jgi:hypothetical protein
MVVVMKLVSKRCELDKPVVLEMTFVRVVVMKLVEREVSSKVCSKQI